MSRKEDLERIMEDALSNTEERLRKYGHAGNLVCPECVPKKVDIRDIPRAFFQLAERIERDYPDYADHVTIFYDVTHGDLRKLLALRDRK
ncbi:hypothetical protein EVB32_148 [Rhizobium phage RHph_TM39]|nr:hypothetical protein EVB96_148 [Rhizobium phage RHph_TM3_3_6]QIG77136.1 hypothetical protein EVB32_148 [Rhizobium phage RHph_TM39]